MPSITVPGLTGVSYDSAVVNFDSGMVWGYGVPYIWHVDAVNQFGTTVGDNWTFNSVVFDPPVPAWELYAGKTLGPLTGGVLGVDYRWLGTNTMNTVKFMLIAKDSSIYYAECV